MHRHASCRLVATRFHHLVAPVVALVACGGLTARAAEIDPAGVTSLAPQEATALVEQGHGDLTLQQLGSLSAETAHALGQTCGRLGIELTLPALRSLPADVAAGLGPGTPGSPSRCRPSPNSPPQRPPSSPGTRARSGSMAAAG